MWVNIKVFLSLEFWEYIELLYRWISYIDSLLNYEIWSFYGIILISIYLIVRFYAFALKVQQVCLILLKLIGTLLGTPIFIILPLLIAIAYYTLAERKIMASIQRRKGPNVVGF